jgi:predicted ATP-grasp superfamily ATP-dependent carboligase
VGSVVEAGERLSEMLQAGAVVLVQPWIPGERLAISFVHAAGVFHGEFAQVAHRMLPILGGDSVMRESVPLPQDAAAHARRLVSELELDGYAEVEFRRDADGTPVLMEINPRLSASIECAVRSGVDFPGLVRAWATDELPDQASSGYRTGVRMRWLAADIKWLLDNALQQGAPDTVPTRRAVSSFFADFGKPTSYDYFDNGDLRPAIVAIGSDMAWLGRTLKERLIPPDRAR